MTKRCTWMIAGALFVLPAAGVAQGGGMQAWQEQSRPRADAGQIPLTARGVSRRVVGLD